MAPGRRDWPIRGSAGWMSRSPAMSRTRCWVRLASPRSTDPRCAAHGVAPRVPRPSVGGRSGPVMPLGHQNRLVRAWPCSDLVGIEIRPSVITVNLMPQLHRVGFAVAADPTLARSRRSRCTAKATAAHPGEAVEANWSVSRADLSSRPPDRVRSSQPDRLRAPRVHASGPGSRRPSTRGWLMPEHH